MLIRPTFCQQNARQLVRMLSSHYAEVGGARVHYVREGTGPHPVLLLPGALGSAVSDFTPQLEGLSKEEFTLIGWDPPGFGKSRPPQRDFQDFFNKDALSAKELMTGLGFSSFSALGWSDGGITALIMAGRFPASVRRLVVFGSNAYINDQDIAMIDKVADVSAWSERMKAPMLEMYGAEFPKLWGDWCQAYRDFYNEKGGDICCSLLPDITAPTLVIHGNKDVMVAQEHVAHLTNNIKGAQSYIFREGKHNLHFKYQLEFNKLVQDFLTQDKD